MWGHIVTTFCMTPFWAEKTKLWAQNKKLNQKLNQNFLKYHIYFRNWIQRSLLRHVKFWLAFERLRPSTLLQVKCWPKVIYTSTQMYTHTRNHEICMYTHKPSKSAWFARRHCNYDGIVWNAILNKFVQIVHISCFFRAKTLFHQPSMLKTSWILC